MLFTGWFWKSLQLKEEIYEHYIQYQDEEKQLASTSLSFTLSSVILNFKV